MTDISQLNAANLIWLYRRRDALPVEVARDALDRIARRVKRNDCVVKWKRPHTRRRGYIRRHLVAVAVAASGAGMLTGSPLAACIIAPLVNCVTGK